MGSEKAPRHGGDSALLIPAWPLRRKVALAVAIPLLLAATFGALRTRADLVTSENAETSASQVTVLRPAVRYLVEAERGLVAAHQTDPDELMVALANIARAADDLLYARDTSGLNASQVYQVNVVLDLSQALRDERATSLTTGTWQAQLRQMQSGVTQLITTIVNAQINPEPGLELLSQAIGGRFSLAMEQALVATARKGDTGSLELFAELGSEGVAIDRLASGLGEIEPAVFRLRTANGDRFRAVRIKGSDLGGTIAYADYDKVIAFLQDDIDARLAATADAARTRALANGGITLGALLAAILLALMVSRIILRPIRRVREGVLSVAHEQLPAAVAMIREGKDPGRIIPIDVTTGEEIGQVARAVDDLHRQAVLLATGEAELRSQVGDMFVTLSRRSTALVNQQLSLIEALEKNEQDPKRLESLFRLDHLAARMRRTADSLLILADAPARSSGVGESLTVGEAMQAATAGVQEYQRVELGTLATVRVRPDAAADLVHVLTELVDNALTYSPPTSQVTVNASASSDAVTIEITDSGLGMADDTLAELNETLHSGGELTPDTARRMGLFVVSRLAKKHGLAVALRPNFPAGTTAVVFLPPTVLLGEAAPQPQRVVAAPAAASVVPEPARSVLDLDANDIAARISGRLPVRQPGAALQSGNAPRPFGDSPAAAPLPVRRPAEQPVVEEPVLEQPVVEEPVVEEPVAEEPVAEEPGVVAEEPVVEEPVAEEPVAEEPVVEEPVVEEPVAEEPVAEEPVEAPAASAFTLSTTATDHEIDSLDAEWTSPSVEEEQDSPIFKAMRSAWLNSGGPSEPWTDNEVEEGWDRAEEVTQSVVGVTDAGLPQRRPGARLVPGGVATLDNTISRDPEEIRARLASHAAGVSRGRRAATPAPDDTEAGTA